MTITPKKPSIVLLEAWESGRWVFKGRTSSMLRAVEISRRNSFQFKVRRVS